MAERVVDRLEVVHVEEQKREPVPVALGALELGFDLLAERRVIEELRQRIASRLDRELRGRAVEVGHDAFGHELVDRVVETPLDDEQLIGVELGASQRDEAPEDAAQDQKLGHDLARREPERLSLARVVVHAGGERAAAPQPRRLRVAQLPGELEDEGRDVPELPDLTQPGQRRDDVVVQPFLDELERELPGIGPDLLSQPGDRSVR